MKVTFFVKDYMCPKCATVHKGTTWLSKIGDQMNITDYKKGDELLFRPLLYIACPSCDEYLCSFAVRDGLTFTGEVSDIKYGILLAEIQSTMASYNQGFIDGRKVGAREECGHHCCFCGKPAEDNDKILCLHCRRIGRHDGHERDWSVKIPERQKAFNADPKKRFYHLEEE